MSWMNPPFLAFSAQSENVTVSAEDRIREAISDDSNLRRRLKADRVMLHTHQCALLLDAIKRADLHRQQHEKVGLRLPAKFYNYELKYTLYAIAFEEALHAKMPEIIKNLAKWREQILDPYEFYGILTTYSKNKQDNVINYHLMVEDQDFVSAICEFLYRFSFSKTYHQLGLKPAKLRQPFTFTDVNLRNFVDGINLVKGPAFTHAGTATNNKDALKIGQRMTKLLRKYPFNQSDIGETLQRYAELHTKPQSFVPEADEYTRPAEFIYESYLRIKARTNSVGVLFRDNFPLAVYKFLELEKRHWRKHSPKQSYTV